MVRHSSRLFVALLSVVAPACGSAADAGDAESVVSATVVSAATPSIQMPKSQAFGTVTAGTSETFSFTANTYEAIPVFSLTGSSAADFSISTGTCSYAVVLGTRACPVTVTFAPPKGSFGSMSAKLVATSNAGAQASMALTGVVIPPTTKRAWVSALGHNGDFGSMAVADALCMADANKPANVVSAKAMLAGGFTGTGAQTARTACVSPYCATGGSGENVDWVLHPRTLYIRPDGTMIGTTTSAAIFPSSLVNPISATDTSPIVVGVNPDWTTTAGANCSSWTTASASSETVVVGEEATDDTLFGTAEVLPCNAANSLYCIEQ